MADTVHKFYCKKCSRYLFEATLGGLAARVNAHNSVRHPTDFAEWKEDTIGLSQCYEGTAPVPPVYLGRYQVNDPEWGNAERPPEFTDSDRKFLGGMYVKW